MDFQFILLFLEVVEHFVFLDFEQFADYVKRKIGGFFMEEQRFELSHVIIMWIVTLCNLVFLIVIFDKISSARVEGIALISVLTIRSAYISWEYIKQKRKEEWK